ncbi:ABC transporter permease [Vibrio cholerae]|uniref:ABC transporter permease n=1 Tax=Vibrio cholerae TaxID=666 RepID=UPI002056329D|nr:putative O-antigen ABC transporter permease [Vibrio cholerae]GHW66689.1 Teichoic acid translocation permease protein TagG [Vibrio cholerae]
MNYLHSGPLTSLINNRSLIYQLSKREILSRYKGTSFGIAWSIFTPLLMLVLYTFVFSFVFKARWGESNELPREIYALVLYTGMITHALFCDCLVRSSTLMHANVSYVKKVVFPLEVLNWVVLFSSIFQTFIGFTLLVLAVIFITGSISIYVLFIPLILLPLCMLIMGVSWFVASMGVYFRDLAQLTTIASTVLMFASPIFYPTSMLPESIRVYIYLNPLTYFIEAFRSVLIWKTAPSFESIIIVYLISFVVAFLGFKFFQRTRKGFSDVL